MADDRLELQITLDDGSVIQGFQRIEKQAVKAGQTTRGAFNTSLSGIGSAFKAVGIAATAAFAAAGFAVGKVVRDGIAEARVAEDALNSLQAAFRAQGAPVTEASERMREYASRLQEVTTVGDDAIIGGAAVLVSIGKLSGEGLERATKAALNLSAGLGKDLNSSFELIAKAAAGNTDALSRYGIILDKNIPKSERFSAVLRQIDGSFGGAAESKVNTYSGAIAQLNNIYTDVLQTIGEMVTKSPAVLALVQSISKYFLSLNKTLMGVRDSGDILGNLIKRSLEFGQTIITYVVAPLEFFYNIARLAITSVSWGIQGLIVLFVAVGNAITKAVIYPLQKLTEGMAYLAKFVNKDLSASINGFSEGLGKIPQATQAALEVTGGAWVDLGAQVKESSANLFNFDVSAASSNLVTSIQQTVENAKEPTKEAGRSLGKELVSGIEESVLQVDSVTDAFRLGLTEMSITAVDVAKTIQNALVSGFSNSFAALGKSLVTGSNGFKDFGKQVLSAIGGLAIQLGSFFLLVGAGLASAGFLFKLSGAGAIAAGIGLTILGGALQAMAGSSESAAGGGVATAGGGSGGGGVASGPSLSDAAMTALPEVQEQRPTTTVQINVQGNILDRRESGLAIADVLNDYFNANDGQLMVRA